LFKQYLFQRTWYIPNSIEIRGGVYVPAPDCRILRMGGLAKGGLPLMG